MSREPDWTWWDETRAIARRHARGASDAADDLAQELAVAALERGAPAARPGAWLERVGRNAEIDRWRVERRHRELAGAIEAPSAPPDPEARVLLRERRGVLRRALAALPRPLRRAALARFHADLPFDAVASRLGTRPVTARTRVHRALERLRARVGGLRAFFGWLPGAQATALGLTLVAGTARPALVPAAPPLVPEAVASAHVRGVATASVTPPRTVAAPAAPMRARASPERAPSPQARGVLAPPIPSAVQRYSFDDDEVEGELTPAGDVVIVGAQAVRQPSLIDLRRQFIPEILKTLEDI
jgi:RNA polymerase sigma factor (sigma-70 family)